MNAELLEALEVLTMDRHMFAPTEFGGYRCKHCDGTVTDRQHFRVGEDRRTDIAKARSAIAKATGEQQ